MPKIPENPKEFFAALPGFEKDLEDKYGEFLEQLRTISPELVARHEANVAIEFGNEDGLEELIAMIGDPNDPA